MVCCNAIVGPCQGLRDFIRFRHRGIANYEKNKINIEMDPRWLQQYMSNLFFLIALPNDVQYYFWLVLLVSLHCVFFYHRFQFWGKIISYQDLEISELKTEKRLFSWEFIDLYLLLRILLSALDQNHRT